MPAVLFVRITSRLDADEFDRRLLERRSRFRDVPASGGKVPDGERLVVEHVTGALILGPQKRMQVRINGQRLLLARALATTERPPFWHEASARLRPGGA